MSRWTRLRESFWFLPALLCALAVVLAEALIFVDRRIDERTLGPITVVINRVGEAGSRDLLGAIAGSTLTVAATTFSITIAVLATASSTYGPRLVRNFMTDRANQFVLGAFVATFLYALLVLRSIRVLGNDTDEVFVPHLAVNVAVLFGMLTIGVLVFFIHHISESIQIWTLAGKTRSELNAAVDRLYPEQLGRAPAEVENAAGRGDVPERLDADGTRVLAHRTGYVQGIDEERLLTTATSHDLVVSLLVRPGSHAIDGTAIAVLWPPDRVGHEASSAVIDCVTVGQARSPDQDVEFAVLVLEEMAVRALSPGTNDPYTAVNALDDLAAGLARLAGRSSPSPYRYDDNGQLRVMARRVVLTDLLDGLFDAMRVYAVDHPRVLRRTLELAEQVGAASLQPAVLARLSAHVARVIEAFERSAPQTCDLVELRRQADDVQHSLSSLNEAGR
ncbi:DUF2254 domain-containing protein [Mycolicibacterium arenosum]|uniref:DUF2254 domain-containing protein n=1 Tax=Mycolicibacterium arenosum TaxID=2952157 RepID=UPI0020CBA518|nr:DUF2254 domain-containing protein [Mycolicibacterium sp. CAU 1645]